MEKEKSVVEFLINQLGIKKDGWNNDVLKKAKSIEKKQREKYFVEGYKTRALASNLIFDEKSEYYAKSLFNRTFKSE